MNIVAWHGVIVLWIFLILNADRISTTEVTEFFLDRAWRDRVSPPSCSESRQNDVVSVKEEEQEEVEEDDDNEADFIALEEQHRSLGNY